MTQTKVMTKKETKAWLYAYFFGKRYGDKADFTEIYTGQCTSIYEWNLDENVEVIETVHGFEEEFDDCFTTIYTVNFYKDAYSGTPYRTGTVMIDGI